METTVFIRYPISDARVNQ